MGIFIASLAGVIVGALVAIVCQRRWRATGTLKIDHSNPEKDIYRFEIDDLDALSRKKRVLLKVDHNADLSQN